MAPTPQSSSEETAAIAEILRGSKSIDRSTQKSRFTQKRYRERQKLQMEEYRQRVAELTSLLSQLSTDKSSLARLPILSSSASVKPQEPTDAEEEWSTAIANFANTVRQNKEPLVIAEETRSWNGDNARQIKMDYVSQLAQFLAAGAGLGNTEALEQLENYVLKCRCSKWDTITKNSWRIMAKVLASKPQQQAASPQLLAKFLEATKLSSDQERDLAVAHRAYHIRSARFARERARILTNLQGATDAEAQQLGCATRRGPAGNYSLGALVEAGRASEELKQNLRWEQRSRLDYYTDFTSVMTPLQEADAAVALYPITMDYHYLPELGRLLCQAREAVHGLANVAPAGGLEQQAQPPFSGVGGPSVLQLPADLVAAAAQPPVMDLPGGLPEVDFFDIDNVVLDEADMWQEWLPGPVGT